MKKLFFLAAALVAAVSMNAETVNFGVVDKTSDVTAKSSFEAAFDLANATVAAAWNSSQTSGVAEIYQTEATTDYETTVITPKGSTHVSLVAKDGNANKLVYKAYDDYIQPNGKASALKITGLTNGQKVKITLKDALNKEAAIEGATVTSSMLDNTEIELVASAATIMVYSKNGDGSADAKWKLKTVEIVDDQPQAVENVEAVKTVKTIENGQMVIIRNGVKYNANGMAL